MGMEDVPNQYDSMGWEELMSDDAGKRAIEEASLEYLQTEDKEYFDREFTGELDSQGYLVRRDGGPPRTKPSQNIGGGEAMKKVLEMTKEKLG